MNFSVVPQQAEPVLETIWYKPGKSLHLFHQSPAFCRGLVGGRGSGKTTSVAMEVVRHCLFNPGAKVLGLRKTEISQTDTTIDTFNRVYEDLGNLFIETPTSLFRSWRGGLTVRVPSLEAVKRYNEFAAKNPTKRDLERWLDGEANKWCSWIEFRGVPDAAKRGNKLRGYECSMAVLIEADLMDKEDYELLIPCLRWKNALGQFIDDVGIIIDTNPPSPRHWIAKLEQEKCEEEKNPKFEFWHIPTEENAHNLQPGYIENLKETYKKNPAMYDRMVLGKYAEAFDGSPVLHAFSLDEHCDDDLPFPKGAYLVRGWDFGVRNAVIWSAYWQYDGQEYWWDLYEYYAEDSDTDRQAKRVLEITALEFPFWNDRSECSGLLDYCDPSGNARSSKGSSDIDILATYSIYPGFTTKKRTLKKTIATYNRLLQGRDKRGCPIYKIDRKHCPMLVVALSGGYRYPKEGESGFGKDEPMKDGVYDHIADASRYPKINCLRLAKVDVEIVEPPIGLLKRPLNINPPKRWR